jgi:hypothetical protein
MAESVQEFEQIVLKLSPTGLVILGLVLVLAGLFFWLGGLPFKKVLIAVLGVFCGSFSGFFVFNQDIIATLILAAGAAFLLVIAEKIFAIIFSKAFFLWYLISAFVWAFLGTAFIFAGMISLLLHKGCKASGYISDRQSFYITVFAAMVAFGTVVQLLLCKKPAKKAGPKKKREN